MERNVSHNISYFTTLRINWSPAINELTHDVRNACTLKTKSPQRPLVDDARDESSIVNRDKNSLLCKAPRTYTIGLSVAAGQGFMIPSSLIYDLKYIPYVTLTDLSIQGNN